MFLEGVSVGGKPLTALPGLSDTAIDASKALKALPQLLNMTMMGGWHWHEALLVWGQDAVWGFAGGVVCCSAVLCRTGRCVK